MAANTITTARTLLLEKWKAKGKNYRITTRPYRSLDCFVLKLIETKMTADATPVPSFGLYQIERGQRIEWFSMGLTDTHPLLGKLTEADTNQIKGFETNAGEDVCIEAVSASARPFIPLYSDATLAGKVTDSVLKEVLKTGSGVLADPGCILSAPQLNSPFNLENAIYEALAPHVSMKVEFGRNSTEYLCELGNIPEGIGRSYLRSHGEPTTNNRFRIPEGIQWLGESGSDSEMVIRGEVAKDVIIPISAIANVVFTTPILPEKILLPVQLRLHGATFSFPSKN